MTSAKAPALPQDLPPRILLGPGPSMVNPRVLRAMMQNMIGYLDRDYIPVLDEVAERLKALFQTEEAATMALSGTGSAGMEAGLASLLEPGDAVAVCICGFFGERMAYMARRFGANVIPLRSEWGAPFPEEMLEDALRDAGDVKMVAIVQAETSTGVRQPIGGVARLAAERGAMLMVDAVTSLGGNEVAFDEWGADYCYSASQKCIGSPPGLSPVAVSPRALESIRARRAPPASWYLDLSLNAEYWYPPRVYHHTSPVSMILALRESLRIIMEEGMENRFARHERNAAALRAGLAALGLKIIPPEGARLAQVTPVWIPEGIDEAQVRARLLDEYNIEIGVGLGEFGREGVALRADGRIEPPGLRSARARRAGIRPPRAGIRNRPRRRARRRRQRAGGRLGWADIRNLTQRRKGANGRWRKSAKGRLLRCHSRFLPRHSRESGNPEACVHVGSARERDMLARPRTRQHSTFPKPLRLRAFALNFHPRARYAAAP